MKYSEQSALQLFYEAPLRHQDADETRNYRDEDAQRTILSIFDATLHCPCVYTFCR